MLTKMRLFTLIIYFVCATTSVFSQTLTKKQEANIRKTISSQFGEEAAKYPLNLGTSNFCILNKDTFFNPSGYNYLFKLSSDTLIRIDHSVFHGNNGRRFLFSWKNKNYTLGGYGFFITNNNLTYFNFQTNEWCYEPVKGETPKSILGITFKRGDTVFTFNNFKVGNNAEQDEPDYSAYKLDLNKMSWSICQPIKDIPFLKGEAYYGNEFVFFHAKNTSLLISPSENKYLKLNNDGYGLSVNSFIHRINKNTIEFSSKNNLGKTSILLLNLDSIWVKEKANAIDLVFAPKETENNNSWLKYTVVIAIIMVIGTIGFLLYKRKLLLNANSQIKVSENKIDTPSKIIIEELPIQTEIIENLINSSKNVLTTDELDYILKIGHLEQDSRKLRRHRLLSEIQKNHPTLITRIKDVADRRRFLYKVETTVENSIPNEPIFKA